MKAVIDEHLIRFEVYNPNNFTVIFTLMKDKLDWIRKNRIPAGDDVIRVKPDSFAILNHAYYIAAASNGAELISVIKNYGNEIGKGNKHPSRPEISGRFH